MTGDSYYRSNLNDPDLREDMRPPPPVLYHYTSAAGFFGIVESGSCLFANHHGLVNDAGEITFGFDIAVDVLEGMEGLAPEVKDLARAKIRERACDNSFIACLSRRRDALSQWRAYADNGTGYCIGFGLGSTRRLEGYGDQDDSWTTHLFECLYGRSAVVDLLNQSLAGKVSWFEGKQWPDRHERLASEIARVAWRYAHLAKHEHFYEECEWRFVVSAPESSVQYRIGARGLTPYLPTEKLTIEQVWIGPAVAAPQVAERTTTRFLARHGVKAEVAYWKSPFRR